jgi:hypothetical protein
MAAGDSNGYTVSAHLLMFSSWAAKCSQLSTFREAAEYILVDSLQVGRTDRLLERLIEDAKAAQVDSLLGARREGFAVDFPCRNTPGKTTVPNPLD